MTNEQYLEYGEFVRHLSAVLHMAKPHLTCHFEIYQNESTLPNPCEGALIHDMRGNRLLHGDWYIVMECRGGHRYYINVTWDSLVTMAKETFERMENK